VTFPLSVVGDPVARFVYDGLGRLAFYSTHLDYSEPIDEHVNRHLYYDGVRRVSEHRHTRVWGTPILDMWDEHNYVWGPDYVDELAFIIHAEGGVRYAIQDANCNLAASIRACGGQELPAAKTGLREAEHRRHIRERAFLPNMPARCITGFRGRFVCFTEPNREGWVRPTESNHGRWIRRREPNHGGWIPGSESDANSVSVLSRDKCSRTVSFPLIHLHAMRCAHACNLTSS